MRVLNTGTEVEAAVADALVSSRSSQGFRSLTGFDLRCWDVFCLGPGQIRGLIQFCDDINDNKLIFLVNI